MWDGRTGTFFRTLTKSAGDCVAVSPDGNTIASGDGFSAYLWDVASGEQLHILTGHTDEVNSVAFSPDGNILASGGGDAAGEDALDATICLWDVETGELLHKIIDRTGYEIRVHSVAFSLDGNMLASGNFGRTIALWNVSTGELHHTFTGHADQVVSVAFSPDGKTLASASWDGTVLLWKLTPQIAGQ